MSKGARWPGDWLAICDVCGFRFASRNMKKRWDDLMVCKEDWEPRHPQDLLRLHAEHITPPWTRPEQPDQFILVCNIWERSCYADLAAADCALADNTTQTYTFLLALKTDSLRIP